MIVYHDAAKRNTLTRTHKGPRRCRYSMTVAGWYAGGISARNDTEARAVFLDIVAREEAAAV